MSKPLGYRQPSANSSDDDPDSENDLDLDLNELDPPASTALRTTPLRQRSSSRLSHEFGARIPLRNLRFGGRRRPKDEDAEDLEALVREEGQESRKRPLGADTEVDDAPLLANGRSRRTAHEPIYQQPDSRWRWWTRLRKRYHESHNGPPDPLSSDSLEPEDDHDPSTNRVVFVGQRQSTRFPTNAVSNAKYTPYSFVPRTLFNEFKFFFNLYFLLVALSQIIKPLRIGYLSTYVAPLAFVIFITLAKEAYDDVYRRKRDREANSEAYTVLKFERGSAGAGMVTESKKRKIKSISERKRGKRRRTSERDEDIFATDATGRAADHARQPSSDVMEVLKASKDLKVGDVVVLEKDQRVPADIVVLRSAAFERVSAVEDSAETSSSPTLVDTCGYAKAPDSLLEHQAASGHPLDNATTSSDPSGGGEAFIRTDQLDGETDWKLRLASPLAQTLPVSEYVRLQVTAGKPDKRVNDFTGTIELLPRQSQAYDPHIHKSKEADRAESGLPRAALDSTTSPLTIDNTAWANTVLASNTSVYAVVIYTGPQTRAALSTSPSRSKTGLLEHEINSLVKILCFLTAALSFILVALEGFRSTNGQAWYVAVMRFLILFSTIVPISLRVNLDMGKSVYAWFIHRDPGIPGTVVRTSTIPEDLGRIEYVLSDKTGTLTRNEMELKKIHVGTVSYGGEAMQEVKGYVKQAFEARETFFTPAEGMGSMSGTTRTRREIGLRVRDLVLALALCHNVTPTNETDEEGQLNTTYQASSPDEIAIVQWTEYVGLRLTYRDRRTITLESTADARIVVRVEILNIFPFTSDSKRMGVIVRFLNTIDNTTNEDGEIVFYQKGADTVMSSIVAANDWLDEETANMAREGLRTLVVGRKNMSKEQYQTFFSAYSEASLALSGRDSGMVRVVRTHLERNVELLGVTGVEDKLQAHVKPSLELLRNAGIKIWMLTGDKVETARCIGISSKLVSRGQYIHTIANLRRKEAALDALNILHTHPNAALLIDGQSLSVYLTHHKSAFISIAVRLPAVIACRCSPTQKADIARLIRTYTKKRIACIGDGGNDVSMIQAADVGVGIVGKEGKQASLAADFSITQFSHLTKLLVWHGRNSYKRSAKLAQFVIHRGLIISVCQTVFSVASHFEPIALYRDWLLVGYATIYTMMPVFSLVLDKDVDEGLANLYPELYKDLTLGKSLSYKTFFIWVGISIYQGLIIQGGSEILVPNTTPADSKLNLTDTASFRKMVALSYTALVINELVMVAAEVTTWHPIMIFSILGTAMLFFGSLPFLGGYFDLAFLLTLGFWWRVAAVCAASLGPVWAGKVVGRRVRPASYRKVRGI